MQLFGDYSAKVGRSLAVLFAILSIFLVIKGIQSLKEYKFIGSGLGATNTISVSGKGEAFAVPDIASISFTTTKDAKTMEEAQKTVTDTTKKALEYLKSQGIAEKDIKTENYNAYPRYEWQKATIMCITAPCIQPEGKNVLVGYSATQTISVKVRKIDQAGALVTGLGALGITNVDGPNFTVDEDGKVQSEAREKAIADAKEKAEQLSRELGVKLVRIVSFSDNGNTPYPMYMSAKVDAAMGGYGGAVPEAASLPTGENKYTSNVTITYEIR